MLTYGRSFNMDRQLTEEEKTEWARRGREGMIKQFNDPATNTGGAPRPPGLMDVYQTRHNRYVHLTSNAVSKHPKGNPEQEQQWELGVANRLKDTDAMLRPNVDNAHAEAIQLNNKYARYGKLPDGGEKTSCGPKGPEKSRNNYKGDYYNDCCKLTVRKLLRCQEEEHPVHSAHGDVDSSGSPG